MRYGWIEVRRLVLLLSMLIFIDANLPSLASEPMIDGNESLLYSELIDRTYDYAFPTDRGMAKYTHFSIVLRYIPSSQPASQIVVRYGVDSKISIDYMAASVQIERFVEGKELDPARLSRLLQVKISHPKMTTQEFLRYFDGFWKALSKSASTFKEKAVSNVFHTDGAIYILGYSADTNISIVTNGSELVSGPHPNDSPLVRWMITFHKEIERRSRSTQDE